MANHSTFAIMHYRAQLLLKNIAIIAIGSLILATAFSCHSSNKKPSSPLPAQVNGTRPFLESDSAQSKIAKLPGNIIVILYADSRLYTSKDSDKISHAIVLDGEAFFKVPPQTDTPFTVHTGMLNLVTRHAYFHVSAHREDAGQSAELLRGKLTAEKAYPSDYPDTETLHAGDIIMINKDIDLMEKETFDTAALSSRIMKESRTK